MAVGLHGLRPSELCGLRVGSVDFARRVIRINEALMPVHRYREARYGLFGGPPKTLAGDRDIPLPGWLCDQLVAMLAARADGQPGGVAEMVLAIAAWTLPPGDFKLLTGV